MPDGFWYIVWAVVVYDARAIFDDITARSRSKIVSLGVGVLLDLAVILTSVWLAMSGLKLFLKSI